MTVNLIIKIHTKNIIIIDKFIQPGTHYMSNSLIIVIGHCCVLYGYLNHNM